MAEGGAPATTKAIFVGINYGTAVFGCEDLQGLPYVYAKSMFGALTELKEIYKKEECRFFSDKTTQAGPLKGVDIKEPTKEGVEAALKDMVKNAKKGDVLLFYFCGHGANEAQRSRGALKTLRKDLKHPDVLYSDQLEKIFKGLKSGVHITFLIHACFAGAMFHYHKEKMKGIALTSVAHDIPSVVRKTGGEEDFTTFIRDDIIKELDKDPTKWPVYQTVYDRLKEKFLVKGTTPDGKSFEGRASMYHPKNVEPASHKFLQL